MPHGFCLLNVFFTDFLCSLSLLPAIQVQLVADTKKQGKVWIQRWIFRPRVQSLPGTQLFKYHIFRTIRRTFPPQNRGGGKSVRLMERRKQIIFSCFLLLKNWCILWKGASYGAKIRVSLFSPILVCLLWNGCFAGIVCFTVTRLFFKTPNMARRQKKVW